MVVTCISFSAIPELRIRYANILLRVLPLCVCAAPTRWLVAGCHCGSRCSLCAVLRGVWAYARACETRCALRLLDTPRHSNSIRMRQEGGIITGSPAAPSNARTPSLIRSVARHVRVGHHCQHSFLARSGPDGYLNVRASLVRTGCPTDDQTSHVRY